MSKRKSAKERRKSVLQSLEKKPSGGVTTHGAKLMTAPLGGTEVICTVEGYCQTFIFEFPGSRMTSEDSVTPQLIAESKNLKAVVVSDLPAYFLDGHSKFPHYAIDVSLRAGVKRTYDKETEHLKHPQRPMFVVIELYETVPMTTFDNGESFLINERRDGEELIEGGREGERALLAIKVSDGVWPDFSPSMQSVNTVLAALKIEQNITHYIDEHYSCSCYVSDDKRAVYTLRPEISIGYGGARVLSPIDATGLQTKVASIRSIYNGIRRDSMTMPQAAELVDSILLDKTQDDNYFRLWYLRLWQAVMDSKKHLGEPKLANRDDIVAGKLTPKQLKEYRDDIAHWWTGKVDFSFITGIQQTAQSLLRYKYRTKN